MYIKNDILFYFFENPDTAMIDYHRQPRGTYRSVGRYVCVCEYVYYYDIVSVSRQHSDMCVRGARLNIYANQKPKRAGDDDDDDV